MRRLIRAITLSRAYQLSAPQGSAPVAPETFAAATEKPLTAEILSRSARLASGRNAEDAALRQAFAGAFPDVLPRVFRSTIQQAMLLANNEQLAALFKPEAGTTAERLGALATPEERVQEAFRIHRAFCIVSHDFNQAVQRNRAGFLIDGRFDVMLQTVFFAARDFNRVFHCFQHRVAVDILFTRHRIGDLQHFRGTMNYLWGSHFTLRWLFKLLVVRFATREIMYIAPVFSCHAVIECALALGIQIHPGKRRLGNGCGCYVVRNNSLVPQQRIRICAARILIADGDIVVIAL